MRSPLLGWSRWSRRACSAGRAEAWIELAWDAPKRLSLVQITFDSGFHRELTLSGSDGVTARTIRAPQPETVRDYSLVARTAEGDVVLAEVTGNHQRLRRHRFEPLEVQAIRLGDLVLHLPPQWFHWVQKLHRCPHPLP